VGLLSVRYEVVGDALDFEDADFLECPFCQLLCEFAICGFDALSGGSLDAGTEPLVLQHLQRSKNSESCRVSGLHGRDEG
jgi:hypothetical protein